MTSKHLIKIMDKMCSMVGVKREDIDMSKEGWFREHEWTAEQDKEFMKWMLKYLENHPSAQTELYGYVASKKINIQRVENFCLQYGWKIND